MTIFVRVLKKLNEDFIIQIENNLTTRKEIEDFLTKQMVFNEKGANTFSNGFIQINILNSCFEIIIDTNVKKKNSIYISMTTQQLKRYVQYLSKFKQ